MPHPKKNIKNRPYFDTALTLELERIVASVTLWAKHEAALQHTKNNFFVCSDELTGMCAVSAARLYIVLKKEGFKKVQIAMALANDEGHAFVQYAGYILDPSAMQFGAPGPLVMALKHDEIPWYYDANHYFGSVHAFSEFLDDVRWSPVQHPKNYDVDAV